MLQQIIRSIVRSVLGKVSDSNKSIRQSVTAVDKKVETLDQHVKNQVWSDILDKERRIVVNTLSIQRIDQDISDKFAALTGMIDDTNLDSIREIADRIKADAAETQTLRSEMAKADGLLNGKIDALLPVELQNKSATEWDQIIETLVAEEMNKLVP